MYRLSNICCSEVLWIYFNLFASLNNFIAEEYQSSQRPSQFVVTSIVDAATRQSTPSYSQSSNPAADFSYEKDLSCSPQMPSSFDYSLDSNRASSQANLAQRRLSLNSSQLSCLPKSALRTSGDPMASTTGSVSTAMPPSLQENNSARKCTPAEIALKKAQALERRKAIIKLRGHRK